MDFIQSVHSNIVIESPISNFYGQRWHLRLSSSTPVAGRSPAFGQRRQWCTSTCAGRTACWAWRKWSFEPTVGQERGNLTNCERDPREALYPFQFDKRVLRCISPTLLQHSGNIEIENWWSDCLVGVHDKRISWNHTEGLWRPPHNPTKKTVLYKVMRTHSWKGEKTYNSFLYWSCKC